MTTSVQVLKGVGLIGPTAAATTGSFFLCSCRSTSCPGDFLSERKRHWENHHVTSVSLCIFTTCCCYFYFSFLSLCFCILFFKGQALWCCWTPLLCQNFKLFLSIWEHSATWWTSLELPSLWAGLLCLASTPADAL